MSKIWTGGSRQIPRGRFDYFLPGAWNYKCDTCGIKWKSPWALKQWDNQMVCPLCFEIRHPQDFLKGRPDRPAPPWTRPDPQPIFFDGGSSGVPTPGYPRLLGSYRLGSKFLG